MNDDLRAESIRFPGHGGAEVEGYLATPLGGGPFGGVVVIHHMPGYDRWSKEVTRRFAAMGYQALCPNLYSREGFGLDPDDAAASARAKGGIPDDQLVGDVGAAAEHLRGLAGANGKVGCIGYCSGGRQSFLAACSLPFDAAVDCYGAFVVGTPPEGFPGKVVALGDRVGDLRCPLLGLFGAEDQYPSPAEVDELERLLVEANKTFEFHSYEGAGHAFFCTDRPAHRPEAALEGWERITEFYGRTLAG